MRQKRSKTYRKLLSSYILHFGFRPPFQVLIDASFAQTLSALHLTPEETLSRLSDVLQTSQLSKGKVNKQTAYQRHANGAGGSGGGGMGNEEIKLMITQCSMVELYRSEKEGPLQKGAVELAKTWERRKCNHREAIPGNECLEQVVGPTNKHRYIIASDSQTLRRELREKSLGVPVVHANQSRVIVLEKMSDKTRQRIEEIERSKYAGAALASGSSASAANIIGGGSGGENADPSSSTPAAVSSSTGIVRGGNRPKAPNPLSNRKPKKVLEEEKREKERRTREIEERTEANRLKKRKLEEQEQEQQQEQARAPTKQMDGPAKEDVRGENKRFTARAKSNGPIKGNGHAKEKEEDRGGDEDGSSRKKRRKRGGRGGSSAKESAVAST